MVVQEECGGRLCGQLPGYDTKTIMDETDHTRSQWTTESSEHETYLGQSRIHPPWMSGDLSRLSSSVLRSLDCRRD